MPARLDHVTLVARDLTRAVAFHDRVLAAAGLARVVAHQDFEDEDEIGEEAVGYGVDDRVLVWLVAGRLATGGVHVAVRVDDDATVDAVAAEVGAVARRRELDRPGYYGVLVEDPERNTVEVFSAAG